MKLQADWNRLTITESELLTSGSAAVYRAAFAFDPRWEGFARTAVFRTGEELYEVLLDDSGVCDIPWEALRADGWLYVGVYGTRGGRRLATIYADPVRVHRGAEAGEETRDPSPDVIGQIREEMDELREQVGSGGPGGVAGVSSFNGRTGKVVPEKGDYPLDLVADTITNTQIDEIWKTIMNS